MAHYAFLDDNNIVREVIVGKNEDDLDTLPEGFANWEEFYTDFRGLTCKRTSYNTRNNTHKLNGIPFRGNYAGMNFTYDPDNDVFIPPKPFDSWILDETTWSWKAPINYPDDGENYVWNESNQTWDLNNI